MQIRRFLLENEKGQRFRLDNLNEGCFLISPSDLGYSYNINFTQVGFDFIENNKRIAQKNPKGIAYFKSYDKVKEFIDYIESSNKLKWIYIIPFKDGEKTYYLDVSLKKFDKTEKSGKWLACPVEFVRKSLWYEAKEVVYTIDSVTNELRWDFQWNPVFSAYDNRNIIFENKGHTEAPFKLELNGEVISPIITILEDDVEVKKLDLTGLTIATGETFIYNTKDTEQEIVKIGSGGTTNLFDFLNPNFINFFKLRKGSSKIRLEAENEIKSGKLTIYMQYKAV